MKTFAPFLTEVNVAILLSSTRRIEITGSLVREFDMKVLNECTLEDFMGNIKEDVKKDLECSTGILPKGSIYYRQGKRKELFVVEIPSKVIAIMYRSGKRDAKSEVYKVSMPFVQIYIRFSESKALEYAWLTCTKLPVESVNDTIYVLPVPNQYDGGNSYMCTGEIRIPSDMPTPRKVKRFIQEFFSSSFNTDLESEYPECFNFKVDDTLTVGGIEGWARNSETNSLFGISDAVEYRCHKQVRFEGMVDTCLTKS